MTDQQDLITPPPDLVEQWLKEFYGAKLQYVAEASIHLAARAAQWGADQELEACCEWLASKVMSERKYPALRAARRPEPMSLKEQALQALGLLIPFIGDEDKRTEADTIRRALEQLND
jgi:hypothetical protein